MMRLTKDLSPRLLLTGACLFALSACSEPELILPGERTSILPALTLAEINAQAAAEDAGLGEPQLNEIFGHAGVSSGHAGGHLSLEWPVSPLWTSSVEGADDVTVELAQPIIAHGAVYALGADGQLHAFDTADGSARWSQFVEVLTDDPWAGIAGGIAADQDHLIAHISQYDLVSFNPQNGEVIWSITHDERLKGGPTLLADEAVMVSDINGRLYVYGLETGQPYWERSGQSSNTIVFGAPAPAYAGNEVVVAGAGGEISVYDAASGDLFWADSLASFNPRTPLQELGDVRAHPVHDGKLIFVMSQSGRMVAYQAASGIDIWEQALTAIELPWLAGDTLYVMTIDGRLFALRRSDGEVRWMAELPDALPAGVIASETVPRYVNPIVASGQVFVIARGGAVHVFDAQTGAKTEEFSTPSMVTTAPAIAQNMLVIINNKGTITAYR